MTNQEIINYYADLLIMQYIGQPKAYATIQSLADLAIINQLPNVVNDAFSLTTSIGDQLDVIGKYTGVTRNGYGIDGSPIVLSDSDFRILIRLAIVQNNGGSSLYDLQLIFDTFFSGQILVFDLLNMRMSYYLDGSVGTYDLAQMFVTQGLLPKPMGVKLASVIFSPNINSFFGYRTYDLPGYNISPYNSYLSYQMSYPFLSYEDAI